MQVKENSVTNISEPVHQIQPRKPSWFARFWQFITGPHHSIRDLGAKRQAQLLAALSLGSILLFGIGLVATLAASGNIQAALQSLVPVVIVATISYFLSRTRYYIFGSWLLVLIISASAYGQITGGADLRNSLTLNIGVALLLGSAILSYRSMIVLVAGNLIIAPLIISFLTPEIGTRALLTATSGIDTIGILLLVVVAFRNSIERQRLEEVKNVNRELSDIRANLEIRVEERTSDLAVATEDSRRRSLQLEAISEVARTIAQLRDINQLLPEITKLISERFGFYHVGIFLIDQDRKFAILRAANSDGGQRMLARNHRLAVGQVGIVGYVAERGEARISLDVGEDATFFDNPDLPTTRSEMALPLTFTNQIIGVLDVQSEHSAAFGRPDLEVMSTLADQVAIAIENARLFSETHHALAEAQSIYRQYVRQEWGQVASEKEKLGYRYTPSGIEELGESVERPEIQAALENGKIARTEGIFPTLAIPLKLRDETIGVLNIRSGSQSRQWRESELALIEAVAERVALAMENARLLNESSRRANKERTISEISAKISSIVDVDELLRSAASEVSRVIPGAEVAIQLQKAELGENQ
jgi:GAF domain-containing protein